MKGLRLDVTIGKTLKQTEIGFYFRFFT